MKGSRTEHQIPYCASQHTVASCPQYAILHGVKVRLGALQQLPIFASKNNFVDIGATQLLQPLSSRNPCTIL
jgi:hypothetical protein